MCDGFESSAAAERSMPFIINYRTVRSLRGSFLGGYEGLPNAVCRCEWCRVRRSVSMRRREGRSGCARERAITCGRGDLQVCRCQVEFVAVEGISDRTCQAWHGWVVCQLRTCSGIETGWVTIELIE